MQQFAISKQFDNHLKQKEKRNKIKNFHFHKIPKIGQKQIPTHTFYKTFYHHNHGQKQIQTQKLNYSQSKEPHESPNKRSYDRPIYLLKKYLQRKQKLIYPSPISNKSESIPEKNLEYKTMNEFRVKKSKRLLQLNPNSPEIQTFSTQNKLQSLDEDFANFNTSKNLYSMTFQELEESIRWKKQFLSILNNKMADTKKLSYRIKNFS